MCILSSFWSCVKKGKSVLDDRASVILAVLFLITFFSFIIFAVDVFRSGLVVDINLPVQKFFSGVFNPLVKRIMILASFIGKPLSLLILWFGVLVYCVIRRYWNLTWYWVFLGLLVFGATGVLKRIFQIHRPEYSLTITLGWSFPSAHTALSTAFFGFLSFLITRGYRGCACCFLYGLCTALVILIEFSFLYLGIHWFTDVVGGILLGLSFLFLAILLYKFFDVDDISIPGLLITVVFTLSIAFGWFMFHDYKQLTTHYIPSKINNTGIC